MTGKNCTITKLLVITITNQVLQFIQVPYPLIDRGQFIVLQMEASQVPQISDTLW